MKIGAVVVTFNRLEKLKKALAAFEAQIYPLAYLIVVDNGSSDGTAEYLEVWKEKNGQAADVCKRIVLSMGENTGGSGGFHAGLKYAMELPDADRIWVSDDDAYPESDALANASEFLDNYNQTTGQDITGLSAICGAMLKNGELDTYHGKNYYVRGLKICEEVIPAEEYQKTYFEKTTLTYVAAIMNREKLAEAGLPNKDFFIYWDDLEHGMRMAKVGRILEVPSVRAWHDTPPENDELNWKLYYSYRNMTATYRKHFPGLPYQYFALKIRVKILLNHLTGNRSLRWTILEAGFKDAEAEKFGLHEIYRPGWKP